MTFGEAVVERQRRSEIPNYEGYLYPTHGIHKVGRENYRFVMDEDKGPIWVQGYVLCGHRDLPQIQAELNEAPIVTANEFRDDDWTVFSFDFDDYF